MHFSRFFRATGAVGALVFVFFVYPTSDVCLNSANAAIFSDSASQKNDDVDKKDCAQNADSVESNDCAQNIGALWNRLDRDERGVPTQLATSIVRFEGKFRGEDGVERDVSVDLIGAIHVAEKQYYDAINKSFEDYETVVFEMVVGRGVDVRAALAAEREKKREITASPFAAISLAQQLLGDSLGLVYQIDGIDYSAPNLRRGDAFAEDFLIEILTNGDVPNFVLNAIVDAFLDRSLGQTEGWALACAVANDKRTTARRLVAAQLADEELVASVDPANERENALIHFRNKKALDVARSELASGRTKIAIFFGVAHMPDMARRLETEFGLTRVGEPRWIPAWAMEPGAR